ncbi:peptide ABC transporter substrate-binding protein [Oscillibacter valericigenes]|uniref:Peptide ABC transporter substrate-binding protein n=1 Tax=Oscillibacter valericigenes TaxID=351091 RepID=A0ABS2FYN3_9FIRM|nr:peptide ABC transporter substrate-binding protein [Oscillibacter valericigenes]MBM6852012.1 peptide ABC transporter substrate-binding protein [Oscillibacter valericigenes]
MKHWKRRLALLLAAALCVSALAGCARGGDAMSLSVCVGGAPEELDPIYATEPADQTILVHLYENLMRKTAGASGATVTNGVAKSATSEENTDGTVTWTFQLRGAEWSDGREVLAGDFVYAWQRLADPANDSPFASLLSVVAGYDEVRETGDVSLLQVTAEDDSTLVVVLNGKYDWFLEEVCTAPATMPLRQDLLTGESAAEETAEDGAEAAEAAEAAPWWSDVAGLVTNGPYQVSGYEAGESLTLETSGTYHSDISGPGTLTFRFADTAEEGQALYDAGTVDFLGVLPEEQMASLVEAESRALTPELGTWAVVFNCAQDTLMDARVRRALSLVIDRTAAAEAAGVTARAAEGLIPPGVPESDEADFRTSGGDLLDNDPNHRADLQEEARALLTEAGYVSVQDLGELEYLYVDAGNGAAVAQALVQAWQSALGLRVTARAVTEEELAAALEEGTFSLAGIEIRALGNDAECFLRQWSSTGGENVSRYANSAYDTLLSVIAGAEDETARLGCLHDAEALLLEEGAVAPLYTTVTAWTLRDSLTGLVRDGRGWFSFAGVVAREA